MGQKLIITAYVSTFEMIDDTYHKIILTLLTHSLLRVAWWWNKWSTWKVIFSHFLHWISCKVKWEHEVEGDAFKKNLSVNPLMNKKFGLKHDVFFFSLQNSFKQIIKKNEVKNTLFIMMLLAMHKQHPHSCLNWNIKT